LRRGRRISSSEGEGAVIEGREEGVVEVERVLDVRVVERNGLRMMVRGL
jgi:hypothetical protein